MKWEGMCLHLHLAWLEIREYVLKTADATPATAALLPLAARSGAHSRGAIKLAVLQVEWWPS